MDILLSRSSKLADVHQLPNSASVLKSQVVQRRVHQLGFSAWLLQLWICWLVTHQHRLQVGQTCNLLVLCPCMLTVSTV